MSETTEPRSRSLSNYYARKAKFTACEGCKSAAAAEVHHVDGDPFNNDLSNLKALCRKCHQAEHRGHYGLLVDEVDVAQRRADYPKKVAKQLMKKNAKADVNWQHYRDMSAAEYTDTIKVLGLNLASAGRYLGRSARTSMRYSRGETTVPAAEVLLLRSLIANGIKPIVPAWKADRNKHW